MPICPHCESEIDGLDSVYSSRGTLAYRGNFRNWNPEHEYFEDEDYLDGDTHDQEFEYHECPDCHEQLTMDEVRDLYDEYRNENPNTTPTEHVAYTPGPWTGIARVRLNSIPQNNIQECPKCKHVYIDEPHDELICPKCDHIYGN